MKKKYSTLSVFNFVFGVCAIMLYLPYTIKSFGLSGFDWFTKIAPNLLKEDYSKVLLYFGIALLAWIILVNAITLLNRPNLPKMLLKLSAISALLLPMMAVLCLKFEWALEFYIKNIAKNIKSISLILMGISCGLALLGLCFNFTRRNRANIYHILQAVTMCALLILMVAVYGWCGWNVKNTVKLYGVLIGLLAVYLPTSSVILFTLRNRRD